MKFSSLNLKISGNLHINGYHYQSMFLSSIQIIKKKVHKARYCFRIARKKLNYYLIIKKIILRGLLLHANSLIKCYYFTTYFYFEMPYFSLSQFYAS